MAAPILIFGGSGGVGAALAREMSAHGASLHLAARRNAPLAALSEELGNCTFSTCDVLDPHAIEQTVAQAAGEDGLSGLAYCVGSIDLKPLKRATAAEFSHAFALNALGAALAVQAAEPHLRAARGAVVLFSTVAVGHGFPNHAIIATAKGSVEGLCRSLAADLAPEVRVNCVAPSLIDTPLAATLTGNNAMAKAIAALHPLPRIGAPQEIAAAAAFLLSDQAGWITGQILAVDGGRSSVRVKG
jgi:NAD(P)-dependent dehydrogenase (short-subunit alcohol dehydrogenase family)